MVELDLGHGAVRIRGGGSESERHGRGIERSIGRGSQGDHRRLVGAGHRHRDRGRIGSRAEIIGGPSGVSVAARPSPTHRKGIRGRYILPEFGRSLIKLYFGDRAIRIGCGGGKAKSRGGGVARAFGRRGEIDRGRLVGGWRRQDPQDGVAVDGQPVRRDRPDELAATVQGQGAIRCLQMSVNDSLTADGQTAIGEAQFQPFGMSGRAHRGVGRQITNHGDNDRPDDLERAVAAQRQALEVIDGRRRRSNHPESEPAAGTGAKTAVGPRWHHDLTNVAGQREVFQRAEITRQIGGAVQRHAAAARWRRRCGYHRQVGGIGPAHHVTERNAAVKLDGVVGGYGSADAIEGATVGRCAI